MKGIFYDIDSAVGDLKINDIFSFCVISKIDAERWIWMCIETIKICDQNKQHLGKVALSIRSSIQWNQDDYIVPLTQYLD